MTTLARPFPTPATLRVALEDVLSRPVDLASGAPVAPAVSTLCAAEYVDAHLDTVAVVGWDLAAACSLGAAASRYPPGSAEDSLGRRTLDPALEAGLRRVADALVRLVSHPSERVRLYALGTPQQRPSTTAVLLLAQSRRRLDVRVRPSTFAAGRCSVVSAR